MPHVDNKRIAKNTLLLYGRMILVMGVSLYTSRVVLNALGVDDYGIYNVVGGFVGMFGIISASLSAAISRFITVELGRGNTENLKKIFSSTVTIQFVIAGILLVLAETVGLWFLNSEMNIAPERMVAANWVYQCSIFSFALNLISVPYNSAIIAHERMSAFAYISVLEAALKLATAFILLSFSRNRLIVYAITLLLVAVLLRYIYIIYSKKHFEECKFVWTWDKALMKEIFAFSGWNFIGASSAILKFQGVNVLLNLFFGTAVNAARGIALQVSHAVTTFSSNFMTAMNPQITKSYASGDTSSSLNLAFRGSKFSFFILFILGFPIMLNAYDILKLWLGIVPEYTTIFTQLIIIGALTECVSNPLITIMLATGNIRNYQIIVGGLQMMNLPVSYVLLKIGFPPQSTMIAAIVIGICCLSSRLIMLRKMVGLSIRKYLNEVILKILLMVTVSVLLTNAILYFVPEFDFRFIVSIVIAMISTGGSIILVGCNQAERSFIFSALTKIKNKFPNNK